MGSSQDSLSEVPTRMDGDVDGVLSQRAALADWCAQLDLSHVNNDALLRCATSLAIQAMLYDTESCAKSLGPFREGRDGFVATKRGLDECKATIVAKARFAGQVANAYYRLGQHDRSATWIGAADEWSKMAQRELSKPTMRKKTSSRPPSREAIDLEFELALAIAENAIWRARIESSGSGPSFTVIRLLQEQAIDPLYGYYAQQARWRAGISHRLGFALSLQGTIYSRLGCGNDALRCLWEALHHLERRPSEHTTSAADRVRPTSPPRGPTAVNDTIRLAYTRLSMCRALVGHRQGSNRLAYSLARIARKELKAALEPRGIRHPLEARALLELARATLDQKSDDEVPDLLEQAERKVDELSNAETGEMLERERTSLRAQIVLTRSWHHALMERWDPCDREANRVLHLTGYPLEASDDAPSPPPGLRRWVAEGMLQSGSALVQLGNAAVGLSRIDRAIALARQSRQLKLEIACLLARAHALYLAPEADTKASAILELERARRMAAGVESYYLKLRLSELSTLIGSDALVDLELPWEEAERSLRGRYLKYHVAKHNGDVERISEATGWAPSSVYRNIKDL